ncbi:Aldo/keto reductase [Xylaria longipes]|nr:Aldo/keto reductase [Xylaria longipes]
MVYIKVWASHLNNRYQGIVLTKLSSGRIHPYLIYGTAFKKNRTQELTEKALERGFEGVDSANFPTSYEESQVGEAIQKALRLGVKREDILVQTKFAPAWAHEEGKVPYNVDQPLEAQVRQSVEQSFANLQVDYIDVLILHDPFEDPADNIVAWRVFESLVPDRVGVLGVSNFLLPDLEKLFDEATVKPEIAFAVLKANKEAISSDIVTCLADRFSIQKETAFYILVLGLGRMSVINGTTSEEHMKTDLEKVKELLENQDHVREIKSYLGDFEALLQEIAAGAKDIEIKRKLEAVAEE